MEWNVYYHDSNARKIIQWNIFKHGSFRKEVNVKSCALAN